MVLMLRQHPSLLFWNCGNGAKNAHFCLSAFQDRLGTTCQDRLGSDVRKIAPHKALLFSAELFPVNQQAATNPYQPAGDPQTQVALLAQLKQVISAHDSILYYAFVVNR
jgi:hypothetical protein